MRDLECIQNKFYKFFDFNAEARFRLYNEYNHKQFGKRVCDKVIIETK